MTKSEKKYWSEYKKKRQKEINDAFSDVRFNYSRAIDKARELGELEGRALAMLEFAKNYTASKTDDYYGLLENPDYKWIDGDEVRD